MLALRWTFNDKAAEDTKGAHIHCRAIDLTNKAKTSILCSSKRLILTSSKHWKNLNVVVMTHKTFDALPFNNLFVVEGNEGNKKDLKSYLNQILC